MLEEAVREEFGLRPVTDFEVEHTHKLGNPLVSNERGARRARGLFD